MKRIAPLALLLILGCNLIDAIPTPKPDDKKDDAQKEDVVSEADVWKKLAQSVTAGVHTNTDQVVLAAENLKTMGDLKDLSRLDEMRKKRVEITDANKESVAATVAGK